MALPKKKSFGTFQGVFTPTILTIMGVIMYLRLPWVVGNAGILGALAIVLLAVSITLCTSLSLSSITTNIRIGSGGPFSIIAQSLGLEIGGSIGIPLFVAQACVVAMYIFGFREGWSWIFPEHPAILVDFIVFSIIAIISAISTDLAFKIQYGILAIAILSIASIMLGILKSPLQLNDLEWFGQFQGVEVADRNAFWVVFAVFFPAVTGITVGATMSGELTNPRKSIPRGTLAAVVLSSLVYIAMLFIAGLLATPGDLVSNYNIFLDRAYYTPIVIAGLLGGTFSAALSSFVSAPRIIFALGEKNILPRSRFFVKKNKRGEPVNAILFAALIIIFSLLFRNLNAIAPLITLFFLITYAMINLVVLIEQSLGLPSFRPTFKVPLIIPLLGALGCFFVMFILNPILSLIALGVVITFYAFLLRKELTSKKSDARSGLFTAMAQWATKKSNELSPQREARAWQPELLIPVESEKEIRGAYRLVYALTHPRGSVKLLGMQSSRQQKLLRTALPDLVETFNQADISASYTFINGMDFGSTVNISMQALETAFFKPNTIFLTLNARKDGQKKYLPVVEACKEHGWGLIMFAPYEQVGLGIEKVINIWLDVIPDEWEQTLDLGNNDLSILVGLIIRKNWNARINLIKTMRSDVQLQSKEVEAELARIKDLARIPKETNIIILERSPEMWDRVPLADLNILETPNKKDLSIERLIEIPQRLRTSCLFTYDSNIENALV